MKRISYMAVSSALTLLMAAGVYAGDDTRSQSQRKQQQQTQSTSSSQQTITGEVESIQSISRRSARGTQEQHTMLTLSTDDGRTIMADAGPQWQFSRLDIEEGDQVTLTGNYTTHYGRQMFQAQRLTTGERTVAIRQGPQSGSKMAQTSRQRRASSQQQTISGTVEGFRHITVRGSQGQQETHTLARIETEQGRTHVVDLGPKDKLQSLDLKKGERVRLQAQTGTLDGRNVLLVNRLAFEDRQKQKQAQTQARTRSSSQQTGRQVTVQGTVQGYQVTSIGTGQNQQVLLTLQLQDGRTVIVDAGKYQPGELNLKQMDLQDQVTIKGRQIQRGNRQMLVADTIRFTEQKGGTSDSQSSQSYGQRRSQQSGQPGQRHQYDQQKHQQK